MSHALGTPVYLEAAPEPLFGVFHAARAAARRDVAVLVCPPFGYAGVCAHRSLRTLAGELAGRGIATLRFDFPGTGDSGGSVDDAASLQAWTDAVDESARWLRARTGSRRVVAVGIGLGGMLAARAATAGAPVDDLVLWAAPARGRAVVRELRAVAAMEANERAAADAPEPSPVDGYLEAAGFLLSRESTEDIEALDLTTASLPPGGRRRALLLERDGIGVDKRLRRWLEDAGVAVTVAGGPGYAEMTVSPHEAQAPLEAFATVIAWLEENSARDAGVPATGLGPHPPNSNGRPPAVELSLAEGRVRETPLSFEIPHGRVAGVLAEPVDGPRAPVCAVCLNVGAIRRIGPGRMWVDLARRWAAGGVPTLRLDIEGIGDAEGESGRYAEVIGLYVPELAEQVTATLGRLEERGLPGRFVLVGLCSGAYWAFHSALQDERVRALFLINPRALIWDASLEMTREARKVHKLRRGSQWRRIAVGDVKLTAMLSVARSMTVAATRGVVTLPAAIVARRSRRRAGGDALDRALDRLRDSGRTVVLAFSSLGEPLYEELEREGRLSQPERWPNLHVELIPGLDHILRPPVMQRDAHALLDRALEREVGLLRAPVAPVADRRVDHLLVGR